MRKFRLQNIARFIQAPKRPPGLMTAFQIAFIRTRSRLRIHQCFHGAEHVIS